TLTIGEHVGTHLDAPIHWVTGKDGADVGSIPASQLVGPACVVDKTFETDKNNGYLLTVADLEAWEAENGRVPDGAWVLFPAGAGRGGAGGGAVPQGGRHRPGAAGRGGGAPPVAGGRANPPGLGGGAGGERRGGGGGFCPAVPAAQLPARRRPAGSHAAGEP